ncbi:hypothetical protein BJ944DRAFT_238493 [Cunninghamella echinulata]|nr:hypothetical protein BJ944DRAFT_238493 [Cunninghamella echinulata]
MFHNGVINSKNTQALKIAETGRVAVYYNHNRENPFITNSNSIYQISLHSFVPDVQQTSNHKPSQNEFDISKIRTLLPAAYLLYFVPYQKISQGCLKKEEKKSILKNKRKGTQFLSSSSSYSQQLHTNNPSAYYDGPYKNADNAYLTSSSSSSSSSFSSSLSSSSASSSPSSLYSTFTSFTYQQMKPLYISDRSSLSDETDSYYSASSSSSSSFIVDSLKLANIKERNSMISSPVPSIHHHQHQCIISSSASSPSNDTPSALSIAEDIWNETQTICNHENITVWLGTSDPFRNYVLQLYINHFDFTGQRLDVAFRTFAKKLYLRAEAQQLDRVIEAFANRFWECNPDELYYNAAYSLLLLNTEFYSAPHHKKMNRSQFIKNTMETILPLLINDEDVISAVQSSTFLTPKTCTPQEQPLSHPSFTFFSRSQSFLNSRIKNDSSKSLFQHYKSQSLVDLAACLYKQDKGIDNSYFSTNKKYWIIQMESLLKENEIVLYTNIKKPDDFANHVPKIKGALARNRGKGLSTLSATTFSNYLKSIRWISKLKKEKDQIDLL